MPRALLIAPVTLALFLAASPAVAQNDPETEVARTRFKQGVSYYDQQEYERARLAFLEAYALRPHPVVLLNLAQSELRAGHFADAATHLAQYIRDNPASDALARARASLDEAKGRSVEVVVTVSDPGSQLVVDGIERGQAPLPDPLYLAPGTHAIRAQKGEARTTQVLTAQAGQRLLVNLDLPHPSSPEPTALLTESAPQPLVASTMDAPAAADGENFLDWLQRRPLAGAALGTAALSLGTAAVLAGFSQTRYDAADTVSTAIINQRSIHVAQEIFLDVPEPCGADGIENGQAAFSPLLTPEGQAQLIQEYRGACGVLSDRRDSANRLKAFSIATLALGVTLGTATVVAYFLDDPEPAEADSAGLPTLRATLSPALQSVSLTFAF